MDDFTTEVQAQRAADIAAGLAQCRVCGCTLNTACVIPSDDGVDYGRCGWIEHDLCSACVGEARKLKIPRAWENECGGVFWIEGHVPATLALLAVVVTTMVDVDAKTAERILVGADGPGRYDERIRHADELLNSVRHLWLKVDPDNDDNMLPATPGELGAEPYTRLDADL